MYYQRSELFCAFSVDKGLSAKYIHKEMLTVYGGKRLSRKEVHNWVKRFSQGRSKVADDARSYLEVAETTVKELLFCGFQSTGKAMDKCMHQCWYRILSRVRLVTRRIIYGFLILGSLY
jgi:hypothetical protein